jgi:ABC-2 type transport system ATP-binding protein
LLASHLLDEVEKVCTHVLILRKGEVLYTGSVDAMSANLGFFELQSDDHQKLIQFLSAHRAIEKVTEENGKIYAHLKESIEAKDLNRILFENGILLNHLVRRKLSLEEQFLELTNKVQVKK